LQRHYSAPSVRASMWFGERNRAYAPTMYPTDMATATSKNS